MYKLSLFLCFSSVLLSLGAEKPTAVGVEGGLAFSEFYRILPGPVIKPCNQPRAPQIP